MSHLTNLRFWDLAGTAATHLRHSSTFGKGPGLMAFGMERCKSRSACNSWRRILGLRGFPTIFLGEGLFGSSGVFFLSVLFFFVAVHLNRWFNWMIMLHVLWYGFLWVLLLFKWKRLEIFVPLQIQLERPCRYFRLVDWVELGKHRVYDHPIPSFKAETCFKQVKKKHQIFGIAWLEIDSQFEKHFQVKKKSQISSELILK